MRAEVLKYLWCPKCHADLECVSTEREGDRTKEGTLTCVGCKASFPIRGFVPRFVSHKSYAASFGAQWKTFARSQIDRPGYNESQLRFDSELGWTADMLKGKTVVEIGSGAGRFVDIVAQRGPALVIGLDITDAVEAACQTVTYPNVQFVQGDVFESPVRSASMDFAYSIGVLHHTPDPQQAFNAMVGLVRPDGNVAVSLYETSPYHRPNRNSVRVTAIDALWALNTFRCELFRLVTTRVPDNVMIAYCKTVIPVLHYLNKIPVLGLVRYLVPSTCYRHLPVICSMVDTMDTYSTRIVHQYRGKDVFQWFSQLGLREIVLMNSRAGWVSLVAEVGDEQERNSRRRLSRQPKPPGELGYLEP